MGAGGAEGGGAGGEGCAGGEDVVDEDDTGRWWCRPDPDECPDDVGGAGWGRGSGRGASSITERAKARALTTWAPAVRAGGRG
ncbi:MAG: hypothetical protein KatS3mg055_0812 [Chloroflexus sp.]|nr:MAG: hypothetical protein KatS3mg055_0812 [Chloroflexus sp.]